MENGQRGFENRVNFGNFDANVIFLAEAGLLQQTGASILEIGSGRGALLKHLLDNGLNITGIEINPTYVHEGEAHFGPLPIQIVDSALLPFDTAQFDIVLSFDVFEHIPDSDMHLAEVRRVLKPGGIYAMQTPNQWTNMVFETIRHRGLAWRDDHCSLHTRKALRERLEAHGFSVAFYDIPVVNDYFIHKVRHYLPVIGPALLRVVNPDEMPASLKTNIYATATKSA